MRLAGKKNVLPEVRNSEELLQSLFDAMVPAARDREKLEEAIERYRVVVSAAYISDLGMAPGKLKDSLRVYAKALDKVRNLTKHFGNRDRQLIFRGLGEAVPAVDLQLFLLEIDRLKQTAAFYEKHIAKSGKESKQFKDAKQAAVLFAKALIAEFSTETEQETRVASLLYELATEQRAGDLSDYKHGGRFRPPLIVSGLTFQK